MKKVVKLGLGLAALGVASIATADFMDFDPKFYLGGELQAAQNSINSDYKDLSDDVAALANTNFQVIKKNVPGLGFFFGVKINDCLAVEAGYTHYQKRTLENGNATLGLKTKFAPSNMYLDVLGMYSATDNVQLIGALGIGKLKTKLDMELSVLGQTTRINPEDNDLPSTKSKVGIRAGLGAQYNFNENWGVRVMGRYQKGNKVIKNMKSLGLGVLYTFA